MAPSLKYLHLSVKTKISQLVVCYQGFNGCQKNWQDPILIDKNDQLFKINYVVIDPT